MAKRGTRMDEARFWELIDAARADVDGDELGLVAALQERLEALPPEDIIRFDALLHEVRIRAYRWPLWGAAYLMNGGCSDDGFEYFRCWLVAQGRAVYEAAVENPDSLADLLEPGRNDHELEELLYVADRAFEEKTGEAMPESDDAGYPPEPLGRQWEEKELNGMFPRISRRLAAH